MADGTELCSITVGTCDDALRAFSDFRGDRVPIVAQPTMWLPWASVPEGVFAIKSSRGILEKKPMATGFHRLLPWEKIAYVITPQNTMFDIPVKNCPTKDNVFVKIDVFLTFRIVDPYEFLVKLSAAKLGDLLKAAQEEAVRNLARSRLHSQIYDLVRFNEEDIVKELDSRFHQYGVEVSDIMITDVRLPPEIGDRLQAETTFASKNRLQRRKQEFEMMQVRNADFLERRKQEVKNEKLAFEAEEKKQRAEIAKEIDEIGAWTQKTIAEIEAEQRRIMLTVDEEAKTVEARFMGDREAALLQIAAKAQAQRDELGAAAYNYTEKVRTETELVVADAEARSTTLLASAEAIASKKMRQKRQHDLRLARSSVVNALNDNVSNVIISGSTQGNLIAEMTSSKQARDIFESTDAL